MVRFAEILKQFKLPMIFFFTFLLSVFLHNIISTFIDKEEPFFFIIAIVSIPAFFITLTRILVRTANKNIKE